MYRILPFRLALVLALLAFFGASHALPLAAQVREDGTATGPNIDKEDFFRAGIAPVHAPAGHDLTIVYFMDYQCPSCRRYTPDVARVLAEDRKVRVIYRDTPIISDLSTVAARAAIAASFQGRHAAFHHALMTSKGRLTEASIRAAADSAKVDWARLQRDLKARGEDIDMQIGRNTELAVATGILGTPAFIVGDRLSNGALDYAGLKAEIADARAATGKAGAEMIVASAKPAASADQNLDEAMAANDMSATPPAPLFRETRTEPVQASAEAESQSETLPWPLLAVAVIVALIAAAWLVLRQRRGRN